MSRTAIHAHGATRFKNDPGLIGRTSVVYKGWFALKNSVFKVFINEIDIENLNKIIRKDNLTEHKVTKHADTLKYNLWLLAYKALPPYLILVENFFFIILFYFESVILLNFDRCSLKINLRILIVSYLILIKGVFRD